MMFRRRDRRADPRWEVAASTQVFSAHPETVVRLVREVEPGASERGLDGLLVARSHPTGWFLCAVRRDDLCGEDLGHFDELVTVRSYLLLRHGPVRQIWTPAPAPDEWRSVVATPAAELREMVHDLGA